MMVWELPQMTAVGLVQEKTIAELQEGGEKELRAALRRQNKSAELNHRQML